MPVDCRLWFPSSHSPLSPGALCHLPALSLSASRSLGLLSGPLAFIHTSYLPTLPFLGPASVSNHFYRPEICPLSLPTSSTCSPAHSFGNSRTNRVGADLAGHPSPANLPQDGTPSPARCIHSTSERYGFDLQTHLSQMAIRASSPQGCMNMLLQVYM